MLKVGIIGVGHMGKLNLTLVRHVPDVIVEWAVDNSKSALSFAKKMGVKNLYENLSEAFKFPELDAAIISLPNYLHLETVREVAEKVPYVYIEKPLASSVDECKRIISCVRRNGARLMVGHNFRFLPCVKEVKRRYDRGEIGEAEIAVLEYIYNGPFAHPLNPRRVPEWWFIKEKVGGGALLDLGYHLIDIFNWLFGDGEPLFTKLRYRYMLEVEDAAVTVLESMKTKTRGIVNVGWFQKTIFPEFNFRVDLHGTAGSLYSEHYQPRRLYLYAIKQGLKTLVKRSLLKPISPLSYTYYYTSYFECLKAFFDVVNTDDQMPVTAEDSLRTMQIIEKAYSEAIK